jgi:Rha family phage regulatory protein
MNSAQSNVVILGEHDVFLKNGQPICTSLTVAARFGKRHADVMRALQALECSNEFAERNFALSEYVDETGRSLPMYTMTYEGFVFLVMGFTGKEAARLKESFIKKFRDMEEKLRGASASLSSPDQMVISKDDYIALLKAKVGFLEAKKGKRPNVSAADLATIYRLRDLGFGPAKIGQEINRSKSTVATVLRRRRRAGF